MVMAKDPVCGMPVDERKGVQAEYQGVTYYFCAPGCRDAFLKAPSRYLGSHQKHHLGKGPQEQQR
jgi:YHS domain-containing protein